MAAFVTLRTMDEDVCCKWQNVTVDICQSYTCIYKKFETVRLIAPLESVDIRDNKIVVYFKTGFYLVIIRSYG